MTTRYAIYYAPQRDDTLWQAGCGWLGRDPAGGTLADPPDIAGLADLTADPRVYGFHATLKPPMRLRHGAARGDVLDAMEQVAAAIPRFTLPPLAVADLGGFLCLRETVDSAALQALSDASVAGLDHLRAAPDGAELTRRRAAGLSPAREANLQRWGYPDVFATWSFHMTLSRRLEGPQMRRLRPAAETWFCEALAASRSVTTICLFEQARSDPFLLTERLDLAAA